MRFDQICYPTYMLERMGHPPKEFLLEYRHMNNPPYDYKTGEETQWPTEGGKPVPTQEEYRAFEQAKNQELERREQRQLSRQSFGSESNKVRFDYKGATITLDADDEAGIERMMKRIENGR